jgi:hypothetical protein
MAERPMGGRAPSGSVKSINPWQSVMQTGETYEQTTDTN